MKLKNLLGTTAKAFQIAGNNSSRQAVGSAFFKPYKSLPNVLFRTTSIITDPVLFAGGTAFFALAAGFYLLKSLVNLITLDLASAKGNISETKDGLWVASLMLVAAISSPIINLVDLIGGAVTSLKQNSEEEEVEDQIQVSFN